MRFATAIALLLIHQQDRRRHHHHGLVTTVVQAAGSVNQKDRHEQQLEKDDSSSSSSSNELTGQELFVGIDVQRRRRQKRRRLLPHQRQGKTLLKTTSLLNDSGNAKPDDDDGDDDGAQNDPTSVLSSTSSMTTDTTATTPTMDDDLGILVTGGLATYTQQQRTRHLEDGDETVGAIDLDNLPPEDLVSFDYDYVCNYLSGYCTCTTTNSTTSSSSSSSSLSTLLPANTSNLKVYCDFPEACDTYWSNCGGMSYECYQSTIEGATMGNAMDTYNRTVCDEVTHPYDQVVCSTRYVINGLVEACAMSFNGVTCQGCNVKPTMMEYCAGGDNGDCANELFWCYQFDCTNTELGITGNDCYYDHDLIRTQYRQSVGCQETCDICKGGGNPANSEVAVNVNTFAANGTFECGALVILGQDGYHFTAEECDMLQSTLFEPCGCVQEEPPTAAPTSDVATTTGNKWVTPTDLVGLTTVLAVAVGVTLFV